MSGGRWWAPTARSSVLASSVAVTMVAGLAAALPARADVGGYEQQVLLGLPNAFYSFEDLASSGAVVDETGNGNDATLVGSSTVVAGSPFGSSDHALSVSGSSGYALTPVLPALSGGGDRTVELWFNTTSTAPQCLFTAGSMAHASSFSICLTDGNQYASPSPGSAGIYVQTYDGDVYVPKAGLTDGTWHYLAVTLSAGSQVQIDVDGSTPGGYLWGGSSYSVLTAQPITLPFALTTSAVPATIGGPGWQQGLTGQVDDVAVYPSALDKATLDAHYAEATAPAAGGAQAWVWGDASQGQLGNLSLDQTDVPSAVTMPGRGFTQISVGTGSVLALDSSGRAWAWGNNDSGQLGDGTTTGRSTPSAVATPFGVRFKAIAAGSSFDLAIDDAGHGWAWGNNASGELGNDTLTPATKPTPITMPAGVTFTAIAAGGGYGLAVDTTGNAWAWGDDTYGVFGNNDPTYTSSKVPVPVLMPSGVHFASISTAPTAGTVEASVLALDTTGHLWGWGFDDSRQLGITGQGRAPTAVNTAAGLTFTEVSAGFGFTVALDSTGQAWTWGGNDVGELGNGTTSSVPNGTPGLVSMPAGVTFTSVSAGDGYALALDTTGRAWSWGFNPDGQLGDGSVTTSNVPVAVSMPTATTFTQVSAGWANGGALGGPIVGVPSIEVTPTGTGVGTITSTPAGIDCPGTCVAPFTPGSEVTLHATPASDGRSFLDSWGGSCTGNPTPLDCAVIVPPGLQIITPTFAQLTARAEPNLEQAFIGHATEGVDFYACSSTVPRDGAATYTWQIQGMAAVSTTQCDGTASGGYSADLSPGDYPVHLVVSDSTGTLTDATDVTVHVRPFASFQWTEEKVADPQATTVPVDVNACDSGGVTTFAWHTPLGITTTSNCSTTITMPVGTNEFLGLVGTDTSGQFSVTVNQTVDIAVLPGDCNTFALGTDACWRQGLNWFGDSFSGPTRNPDYVVVSVGAGVGVVGGQIAEAVTCDGNTYAGVSLTVGVGGVSPISAVLAYGYVGDTHGPAPTMQEIDNYVANEDSAITVGAGGGLNYTHANVSSGPSVGVEYWSGLSTGVSISANLFGTAADTNISPAPGAVCTGGVTSNDFWLAATDRPVRPNTTNATPVVVGSGSTPVVDGGFYVSAGGWAPGTDVTITLHSTPITLATVAADQHGNIGLPLTLPDDFPLGEHTIIATGLAPDGSARTLSSTIDVVAAAPDLSATFTNADGTTYTLGTWTNQPVTATFMCTEPGGPGITSVTAPITTSSAGGGQTVTGTCTDSGGVTTTQTFGPIDIDMSPPEARLQFDPNTNDLIAYGTDSGGSGITTAVIAPIVTSGPHPHTRTLTFTLADGAGNTTVLIVTESRSAHSLHAHVVGLSYDSQAVTRLPRNGIDTDWTDSRNDTLVTLEQHLRIDGPQGDSHVDARYRADDGAGQTIINGAGSGRPVTLAGMHLIKLQTTAGRLTLQV